MNGVIMSSGRYFRLLAAPLVLAACGPDGPPTAPEFAKGGVAAPLTVMPETLTFTIPPTVPASFTARVQFDGLITASTSDAACATVAPLSVPATKPPGSSVYLATFTVTPVGAGVCTITVTDKKGDRVLVQVQVQGAPKVYVANHGNNSITVYPAGATGDASPMATITGPSTGLFQPNLVTLDGTGRIYVANRFNDASSSITVYPAGATGDASPTATITGPSTELLIPQGIAVDATGRLYVANFSGASITIYAAGATGDANPVATIAGPSTGLTGPGGIALDGAGKLYVANGNMILVYAAGATGDAAPIGTIAGPSTGLGGVVSVALDAAGRLYAISHFGPDSSSITVYAAGATGDASPIATITGPGTGLNVPEHIALDGAGRIYVTNWGTTSVTVYASGTTGDASPIATITGPNTGLSSVGGLAVGP